MSDKLTVKELQMYIDHGGSYPRPVRVLAKELLAALLDIERLQKALEFYKDPSDYIAPLTGGMGKLYFDCGAVAKEALEHPNKDSA